MPNHPMMYVVVQTNPDINQEYVKILRIAETRTLAEEARQEIWDSHKIKAEVRTFFLYTTYDSYVNPYPPQRDT